jgi:hypothetical protein
LKTAIASTEKKITDNVNNAGTKNFLPSSLELISSYIKRKPIKIRVPISVLDPMINPVEDIVDEAIVDEAIVDEAIVDDSMLDNIYFLFSLLL